MNVPTLEETYHKGTTLGLCHWSSPVPPKDIQCGYGDAPSLTNIVDRYNKSIADRIVLPPATSLDMTITLQSRLVSSMNRVPHIWTARVQYTSSRDVKVLVAKIFDPTFFEEAEWYDPFALRDLTVWCEVESYRRLRCLQGTKVPQFYGHFVAPIPSQHNRTVNVLLLEYIQGENLQVLVPPETAKDVCSVHKDAIIDNALRLFFDILAVGVEQNDMQPRNVILRPQQLTSEQQDCIGKCPLHLKVDLKNLQMVMVDFELVEFKEPKAGLSEPLSQRKRIDICKATYLARWLENGM